MLPADWLIHVYIYPHHMTLLPSSFYGKRCYGIYLYSEDVDFLWPGSTCICVDMNMLDIKPQLKWKSYIL